MSPGVKGFLLADSIRMDFESTKLAIVHSELAVELVAEIKAESKLPLVVGIAALPLTAELASPPFALERGEQLQ